jgi:hypothetical protein
MKEKEEETTISDPLSERDVFQVNKKKRIGRYFNMTSELGGYDMDGVMLDLGYDGKFYPRSLGKCWVSLSWSSFRFISN